MKNLSQRFRELRRELDGVRDRLVARIEPDRVPRPARQRAVKRGNGRSDAFVAARAAAQLAFPFAIEQLGAVL